MKGVGGQFVSTKKHRKRKEVIMATHWLNTENKLYLTEIKSYIRHGWTSGENLESTAEFDCVEFVSKFG